MSIQTNIIGFENYSNETISELKTLFIYEKIESRPIKFNDTVIWLDANQKIHRKKYPAVERLDGSKEYWTHGVRNEL